MFWYNARLQKQRPSSPPVLGGEETYWEVRRDASSPPIYKSAMRRAQARAQGRACWRSRARLRMGGEEESARTGDSNPGCNYLVRGYSPSMHFFWGGDMPHYSPPLPFRRGREGCPCVLASSRGRPAQGSRTCALAGVPRPVPRAAYVRDGPRARPCAWRGGRSLARCVACPGPRPRLGPRTCALAGGPAPVPGAGVADGRSTVENGGFQSRL